MTETVILGIDPGLTGAVGYIAADWCAVKDLPTKDGRLSRRIDVRALAAQVQQTVPAGTTVLACIEQLLPGGVQAEGRGNTHSAGIQHATHALIVGTLELLGLEVDEVAPQTWKRLYGLTGKGQDRALVTKQALQLAQQLYPELLPDLRLAKNHNRAEAVLIAHWFKRVRA